MRKPATILKKIFVKNLQCTCCKRLLTIDFEAIGVQILEIKDTFLTLSYDSSKVSDELIDETLSKSGVTRIYSKNEILVSQIIKTIQELIFEMNHRDSIFKKSEYLVEKLGYNYRYLARIFLKIEGITLEKFIINCKINKLKILIKENEYSLSEIAYMMDYSSVQYLSNQFKKETGWTVTEFKNLNQ